MRIRTFGGSGKTNPNKAKVKIGKMNISIAEIKDYGKYNKQSTTNVMQNKPKQSQFQRQKNAAAFDD